jgi:hypothetical protein
VKNMFANFMALSREPVCSVHHRCDCRGYIDWLLDYLTVAATEVVSLRSGCWRFTILDLNLGVAWSPHVFVSFTASIKIYE